MGNIICDQIIWSQQQAVVHKMDVFLCFRPWTTFAMETHLRHFSSVRSVNIMSNLCLLFNSLLLLCDSEGLVACSHMGQ